MTFANHSNSLRPQCCYTDYLAQHLMPTQWWTAPVSSEQESEIENQQQSAIMQVAVVHGQAGRRCVMAVCPIILENDSSVLDLFSMSF